MTQSHSLKNFMQVMHYRKLIIVGGPNGSGKTTFATEYLQHEKLIYDTYEPVAFGNASHTETLSQSLFDTFLNTKGNYE